jgi:cytochrome c556
MKLRIALTLAALACAGSAFAQPPAPTPEMQAARQAMMQACSADMKTLCDGKQGREMMQCMRENADKTSAPCKDAMSKMPARRPPLAG